MIIIKFDTQVYPYNSKRNVIISGKGMTASGNPYASKAGADILAKGGNAVDAIIAMASTLSVVEPTGNGIGCDNFALIHMNGKLYGINGSGPSPKKLTYEVIKKRFNGEIPQFGIVPLNVPGGPGVWWAMHERFGNLSFSEVLEPSINYARDGYIIQPNVGRLWKDSVYQRYAPYKDRPEFKPWFDTFTKNGAPYQVGDLFKSEDTARTLERIAITNSRDFYEGESAERIVNFVKEHGGFMELSDLSNYKPQWVDPISINYKGYDIFELPPNGHGITVLMALNILKGYEFTNRDSVETIHKQIEAMKLSMVDTKEYVSDPSCMNVTVDMLLSEKYADKRRSLITDTAIDPKAGKPSEESTVYFAAADKDGNMVSMIQSNFYGFGSGILIPETGITMNNRAFNFNTDKKHPNCINGGKRPYHTIIPAFITKDNKPLVAFGIMGGFMQPQAHVQVAMNMIDFNLNPQAALDAPRFQWIGGKKVEVEQDMPNHIIRQLQNMGHEVIVQPDSINMGRGQVIYRDHDKGIYIGGTEKRTDSYIAFD